MARPAIGQDLNSNPHTGGVEKEQEEEEEEKERNAYRLVVRPD